MKIKIEGSLYLESDGMQFILKQYNGKMSVAKDTGKETEQYKTHGYFSTVKGALEKVVKMKVMDSTATTLGELLKELEGIRQYIESKVTI
ncbi:hypothetical protein [Paenibacillus polymyxa]|uniref:hypothetical protein n=1 Tax=Paenibacillus polymyxa TaxID=1406 RepID=UPI0006BFCE98|nr:hypothetical protein [Paenibacillus polymyxa]KAF6636554.1 hypothetical protein H6F38_04760 [Paenibacillus sp. EKM208P]KOS04096.1 hypothetical protein AM598_02890 [Paenibacillus polymyxa]